MIETNDCRQSIVIKNQFVSGSSFFNFDIDIMIDEFTIFGFSLEIFKDLC